MPVGGPPEFNRVRGIGRKRVTRRDLAHLLRPVRQAHQRVTPDQVGHAGRRLETDLRDSVKRQPEIAPVDDGFAHRAETGIAVHQPVKGLRLLVFEGNLAGGGLRLFKGFQTQRPRALALLAQRRRKGG